MTKEDFDQTLRDLNHAQPFCPFTVELTNGERLEVSKPGRMAFRAGTAVYVGPRKIPHIFYHNTVARFVSSGATAAG